MPENKFSRLSPSPRYRELLSCYRQMHIEGDTAHGVPSGQTFPGLSLVPQVERVKKLIDKTGAKTLLDYGCGKGIQYTSGPLKSSDGREFPTIPDYWGVHVRGYDPAYIPHSDYPEGTFDGVICTDVLEHCPQDDMDWILEELFSHATRFVFATVACYPAKKTLPNGENAHCTVQPVEWWRERIDALARQYPNVLFEFVLMYHKEEGDQKKRLEVVYTNAKKAPAQAAS